MADAGYRQVEHTADCAIEVWADDRDGLFAASCRAMFAVMGDPGPLEPPADAGVPGAVAPVTHQISSGVDVEDLLVRLLTDLIGRFETEDLYVTAAGCLTVDPSGDGETAPDPDRVPWRAVIREQATALLYALGGATEARDRLAGAGDPDRATQVEPWRALLQDAFERVAPLGEDGADTDGEAIAAALAAGAAAGLAAAPVFERLTGEVQTDVLAGLAWPDPADLLDGLDEAEGPDAFSARLAERLRAHGGPAVRALEGDGPLVPLVCARTGCRMAAALGPAVRAGQVAAGDADPRDAWALAALTWGRVDKDAARGLAEIKAVTYHDLSVRRDDDGRWHARVVFDL